MKNKNDYKSILIFSGVIFFFTLLLTIWAWGKIPADTQVPIHWNIKGEVDRYGSKTVGLLVGPITVFFLTMLLLFIPRMEPRQENFAQSQKAFKIIIGGVLLFVAGLHIFTILTTLGYDIDISSTMAFGLGILFMAIGNYLGKIRSNFMLGIRTPWTLSSEKSWNKTHRLGGWLFFFTGFFVFSSGFFHNAEVTFALLFGGLFGSIALLFGYSYWIWREDDRRDEKEA